MQTESSLQQANAQMDNNSVNIDDVRARAALFRLAGRCLEEEMDSELLNLLRGDLREPLAEAGWVLDETFLQDSEETLLETLAEEFTGLFVAPGCVSPYASVFETGCMFREPADRINDAYREAGWDYQRRMSGEFPDHVGTMLGFIGELAAAEVEARENNDQQAADLCAERGKTFLLEQVGPWIPGWCRRAADSALLPFYRQLLMFSEQLLWQELAAVVDRKLLKELVALNQREPKKLDYDADFRKASGL